MSPNPTGDELLSYFDIGVLEMRPKLLLDVQYRRRRSGISFRARQDVFTVKGDNAYDVMLELAPFLTGESTLTDICAHLKPVAVDMAVALIQTLRAHGCVVDHKTEVTALTDGVQRRFAAQIEFISQLVGEPLRHFERFHKSRVLIAGSGCAVRSVIAAFARNGIESLVCDRASLGPGSVAEVLRECRAHNPEFEFETVVLDTLLSSGDVERQFDLCCYVSERPDPAVLARLFLECRRRKTPFIPGVLITDKGFVGPLSNGDGCDACWFCFLMRRCESIDPKQSSSVWRAVALQTPLDLAGSAGESHQAPGLIANLAAFEAFKFIVGHLPSEIKNNVCAFDLATLECRTGQLLPHPLCPYCRSVSWENDRQCLATAVKGKVMSSLSAADKLRQLSVLVDPDMGIIERFDDDDATQLPMFRAAAVVREYPEGVKKTVMGYSLHSYANAKLEAVNSVLRHYGAWHLDHRRLWVGTSAEAQRSGHHTLHPSDLSGALVPSRPSTEKCLEWMSAISLPTEEACFVPGAAVYPLLPLNPGMFERVNAGVGIGHCFEEARAEAIRSRVAYECLRRLALGRLTAVKPCLPLLRQGSANLELILVVCAQLEMPFRLLSSSCFGVVVTIAFSPALGVDAGHIAVAANEAPGESVATALTDLVAMVGGGHVSRPLSYYLPARLGYCLDVARMERQSREEAVGVEQIGAVFDWGDAGEIILVNMTTDDVRTAGFTLVKALWTASGLEK